MKNSLSAPLDFLDDFHGNKSSKRFWGNRLLTIGVLLALFIFAVCFLIPVVSFLFMDNSKVMPTSAYDQCKDIINLFIGGGFGLLFGGVIESFGKKNDK